MRRTGLRPAVQALPTRPDTATWWRAVQLQFLPDPLYTVHTARTPGRYNPGTVTHPGPEVLYLAPDQQVAQFEVEFMLGSPLPGHGAAPNPWAVGWAFVQVQVNLNSVVDLTVPAHLIALQSSVQELTGEWRGYAFRPAVPPLAGPVWSNVPTHRLGWELHRAPGVEGFVCHSARLSTRANLIVFPDKLAGTSFVRCTDPSTGNVHELTP